MSCSAQEKETASGNDEQTNMIVDLESWSFATTDPFPEHRPETIDCPALAFRVEIDQLEIQMDFCNYAVLEFAATQDVKAGTLVELLILHTGLWALESGNAHVAWTLGTDVFWEASPEIPASSEFFFHQAELTKDIRHGDPIRLHLHNHGANDWRIGYFKRMEEY